METHQTSHTAHPYHHVNDQPLLMDFFRICRAAGNPHEFPAPIDLRELLALPEVRQTIRLWQAPDGKLAAYALVDPYHNLVSDIHPELESITLEDEIVAWGVYCRLDVAPKGEQLPTLDCACRAGDLRRIAMLQRNGFQRLEVESIHLERDLSLPIPAHPLPAGFVIRPSAGNAEVDEWVALHRATFGSDSMTSALRVAMLAEPLYQFELDLVCVAPDGRLAGYCCCGLSDEDPDASQPHRGYTDPVAVHPAYERLGLFKALLANGSVRLHARGVQIVEMGTPSDNPAMLAAARALGFAVTISNIWFSKSFKADFGA